MADRARRSLRRMTLLGVVILLGVVASPSMAASPKALYTALLTTAFHASELPNSAHSIKVGVLEPTSQAKSHHVVGEVQVAIDDGAAVILYYVFATHADAVADWKGADLSKTKSQLPLRGFPQPARILNFSLKGKNAFGKTVTNGVTLAGFVSGSVIVAGATLSASQTASGDIPGAIKLAHAAFRHLNAVRAKL